MFRKTMPPAADIPLGIHKMKYSLSNLLLVVAIIAVSIAWWSDRRKLSNEIIDLNAECDDLMQTVTMVAMPKAFSADYFPDGKLPPQRVYEFNKPDDREKYRRIYGHLMAPTGGFIIRATETSDAAQQSTESK